MFLTKAIIQFSLTSQMLNISERHVSTAKHSLKNAVTFSLSGDTFLILCLKMSEPVFQKTDDSDSELFINHNGVSPSALSVTDSSVPSRRHIKAVTSGCRCRDWEVSYKKNDRFLIFDYQSSH